MGQIKLKKKYSARVASDKNVAQAVHQTHTKTANLLHI